MLRALFEREITPDLVLGTSVGALNGALVARDPTRRSSTGSPSSGAASASRRGRGLRRQAAAHGPPRGRAPAPTSTPRSRCSERLERGARRHPLRGPAGAVPGVRGQHRAGRRALVRLRPGRGRRRGQRRRARPAAAGQGRRRALPRRRHRQLHPAGPRRPARRDAGVRAPGRPDRPAAQPPRKPWEVARVSFEIARRHRFVRELAELPDDVECHVLPARGTSGRDDTIWAARDFGSACSAGSTRPTTPASTT